MSAPGVELAVATVAVNGSVQLSTVGTTASLIPALVVSFVGEGQPVEVKFSGRLAHTGADATVLLAFLQDGVIFDQREVLVSAGGKWTSAEVSTRLDARDLPTGIPTCVEVSIRGEWAAAALFGGDVLRQCRLEVVAR